VFFFVLPLKFGEKRKPFGRVNRRAFMLKCVFVEPINLTLVRQNRIAAASDDRGRTATTTSGELNCVRNHAANLSAFFSEKQPPMRNLTGRLKKGLRSVIENTSKSPRRP
jgi:hypothetical protein